MSENTPKLDLLMKDPVLDGHEYFNVKTMLNDNWEKIDTFADTVDGEVKELQQRLDTEQRKEITLQPGVQIIESDKTVPFRLTGLKGRTLVNLLGRDGNCENTNRFTPIRAVLTADTTIKTQGTQSLKITSTGLPTGAATGQSFSVKAGSYYILVGDVKLGSGTYAGPHVAGISNTKNNGNATDTTTFSTVWRAYSALSNAATVSLVSEVVGPVGSVAYFDALRFYEITAEEYAALDNMSAEQVGAKYPYVDGIKPVRNPYVIRYGENLLPPFYEWSTTPNRVFISDDYEITGTLASSPGTDAYLYYNIPFIAGETYTLSNPLESNGVIRVSVYIGAGQSNSHDRVQGISVNPGESRSFTVNLAAVRVAVNLSGITSYVDEFDPSSWIYPGGTIRTFKKPILCVGSEAKAFKAREDSRLALQTDLYADPLTGVNADRVFERDGQYFKSKKWNYIELGGNLTWQYSFSIPGAKLVKLVGLPEALTWYALNVVKFDGKLLSIRSSLDVHDAAHFNVDSGRRDFYLTIPASDSGWGDNFTNITSDEIKAYFMGWTMYNGTVAGSSPDNPTNNFYNGTGTKAWVRRSDGVNRSWADWTNVLPTTPAPNWTPYKLIYQLATPTVEPIVSEGQLTLNKGSNQIEVGSGIVLQERANPLGNTTFSGFYINNTSQFPGSVLAHRVQKILDVYKNSRKDNWRIVADSNSNGREQAFKPYADFDSSATYNVTYLMQDKSPLSGFLGSVPDNEKSLLDDLVQDVQQASARISVVENKKEDMDKAAPVWITPTLLNSWVEYDTYRQSVGYYKDTFGRVHVYGYLKGGISSTGSTIFILPPGFRPTKPIEVFAPSVTPANVTVASTLMIHSQNGNIVCNVGVANGALLLDFSFMTM
ncbi:hypothetical protein [Paenibacillus massiliensis]|uniref:hypothetical protein n=1 Tax=Paenibacillus massiliensis TaxID=225917 RepID=UPI0004014EE8|nr:hypothetical protein [Paenibacillus massiliensis]